MLAVSLERLRLRGVVAGTAIAGASLHHEPGAIVANMGNHCLAVVQAHRVIEAYGKHEVYDGSGRKFKRPKLQEDSRGRQVPRPATTGPPAGHRQVNGGGYPVSLQQTTFQRPAPPSTFGSMCSTQRMHSAETKAKRRDYVDPGRLQAEFRRCRQRYLQNPYSAGPAELQGAIQPVPEMRFGPYPPTGTGIMSPSARWLGLDRALEL